MKINYSFELLYYGNPCPMGEEKEQRMKENFILSFHTCLHEFGINKQNISKLCSSKPFSVKPCQVFKLLFAHSSVHKFSKKNLLMHTSIILMKTLNNGEWLSIESNDWAWLGLQIADFLTVTHHYQTQNVTHYNGKK